jgi:AcrR family transcriptional regulator
MAADSAGGPRRTDALRNRAHILEVAYPAFASDPDVSLNAIAKLAGVGAGTLYRHFPTREDLVLAVYAREVDALIDSVDQLLVDEEPLDALRIWIRRLAAQSRLKHGLGEALTSAQARAAIEAQFEPVTTAIGRLLRAASAAGDIDPAADPSDVLLLASALWRVPPGEQGLAQADRLLELIIRAHRP